MMYDLPLLLLTVAQRFNAGLQINTVSESSEGRKNVTVAAADPALKRWAIIG